MKSISLPAVSIVIPAYNSAEFLPQALESVWQQTYTDYEVIVIDDGSTDNTREVIEPYIERLNYIYQPNQGVAAARNQGIEAARGELIAFLDADDLFLPQKLQQQVAILETQPDVDLVVSGWQVSDETGNIVADVELWHDLPALDLNTWLYWKPVLPSATIIRRSWLQKVGGFPLETVPVEDVECFLRLVAQGCKAVWCKHLGTIYRQINPQSLCRNTLKRVQSLELLHQRLFASANLSPELRQEENRVTYCNYVWCAWHLYQNGYHAEMNDYLRKSLKYTTQSAAEISLNWIESFENYGQGEDTPINTYQLTQTPGWQQLTLDTLSTRQPKVSVIIPAYNSAKYLPEAIASVWEQTYTNYEIILINDGSTDNTREVIKPYLKRIRYFEQENQGVSATRNRGIYLARGELIAFLDADDIFLPQKLAQQVAILDAQPDIGIVNSGFRLISETGAVIKDIERWHKIPDLTPEIWLLHKPVLPSAMMFRKAWLLKVSGFDPRFFASEDVDIVLRMVIWGCQSTWLKEIVVLYRQHETSASWRNPIRHMANAELMQESFFARPDIPQPLRKLEPQARYDFLVWIACVLYQAGCIPETIAYLKKSLLHSPYSWPETIVQWIKSFQNSAKLNARPFDPYALSQLPQWQELILKMRLSKVLDTYSDRATDYQLLAIQKPELAQQPVFAAAYVQLGQKLIAENDLEQALIWLRKAVTLEPQNYQYQEVLGDALISIYDLDSGVATYRQALRLQPNDLNLKTKLDSALELQQQWQDLIAYCQQLRIAPPSDKLRILAIFPYPPYPPQKGGAAIRMFEQIKYLGRRHQLTVVAFVFEEADLNLTVELEKYCDRAWLLKLGKPLQPYQEQDQRQLYNFKTWNMYRVLQQLSQVDFDVVSFEFIISTVYRELFSDRLMVLNEHNIESQLLSLCAAADKDNLIPDLAAELNAAKAFLDSEREAKLLATYENQTWQQFPLRTVVSQANQQELDRRCHRGKTIVVKNGIDTQQIQPVGNPQSNKILFMGTMSYYPNIDSVLYFTETILPLIWQSNPEISFCIAGREPPQILQDLAQKESRIQVIANPENMSAIAAQCNLTVVPLRSGSGTRIKILHGMAMGLPVVSTTIGCEGLEVSDRQHLLVADLPTAFAQSVLELIADAELWHSLQAQARQLVESSYDWHAIFADYEQELINTVNTYTKPHLV